MGSYYYNTVIKLLVKSTEPCNGYKLPDTLGSIGYITLHGNYSLGFISFNPHMQTRAVYFEGQATLISKTRVIGLIIYLLIKKLLKV